MSHPGFDGDFEARYPTWRKEDRHAEGVLLEPPHGESDYDRYGRCQKRDQDSGKQKGLTELIPAPIVTEDCLGNPESGAYRV
jgi:hypothetical protein